MISRVGVIGTATHDKEAGKTGTDDKEAGKPEKSNGQTGEPDTPP
jgi:hypothetical protein